MPLASQSSPGTQRRQGVARRMVAFASRRPVASVLIATTAWVALLVVFMGLASIGLGRLYGDAIVAVSGRLAVTACLLLLMAHLGWLTSSGVLRLASWRVWLLAAGALTYLGGASLYSFFGVATFDASLLRRPGSGTAIATHVAAGLAEEVLFRGFALYALARVWGTTQRGLVRSVVLSSLLFAALHLTQVFTYGVSVPSALLLTLQTFVVSVWWGALVIAGGSIWPAVMLHVAGNALSAPAGV